MRTSGIGLFYFDTTDMPVAIGSVLDGAACRASKDRGNGKGRGRALRGTAGWM